ncbi:hypothetical protein G6F37_011737 [Rhizopus arrhizus]|nr:hypothetical protein G6F38_011793 [Rhizopus arrhizus]KAG1147721.1 hypothetical protein G6F37_011737 [Rhizopus arrhizus]
MPSNSEILITSSQAACIFYGDTLTTENEILNEAKIAAIQDVELCYIDTPYKRYRHAELSSPSEEFEEAIEEVDNETKDKVIHSESQLIEFINDIFLVYDPQNEGVYERFDMSSSQIFSITKQHTGLYQDRKIGAFTQFSKKCGAKYLNAQISRKRTNNGRIERKTIYLMKEKDRAKDFKTFWSLPLLLPARNHWYRVLSKKLPTATYLHKIGTVSSKLCRLCGSAAEDIEHFVVSCPNKNPIWSMVLKYHFPTYLFTNTDILNALHSIKSPFHHRSNLYRPFFVIVSTTQFYIWKAYWQLVINSIPFTTDAIITTINRQIHILLNRISD